VDEKLNSLKDLMEKVGDKVGESGNVIQEGLKTVTGSLEDMVRGFEKVDGRQELMMKEIEVLIPCI
jgi:hypothetical protein